MLLHGLAGHAREWDETAHWLTANHRVLAPDLRGHGRSERHPRDVSRDAHVADVAAWIEHLDQRPVALIGQSLGGHTAFLVAARDPGLVERLVVVEASPGPRGPTDGRENSEAVSRLTQWLESWPRPFSSREQAVAFFDRNDAWAKAWADGLEPRPDGLYPAFDRHVIVETLTAASGDYWDEWRSITCPTLLVIASEAPDASIARDMLAQQPNASLVEIADAGHDLHLDNPAAWREALDRFLG